MKKKNPDNYIILGHPEKADEARLHLINKYAVEDFDIKTLFADEISADRILEETEFLPLFSGKKILHVKNAEKLSKFDCEKLAEYFETPARDVCVIISGASVKAPLQDYADISAEKESPGLFQSVFRMSSPDDGKKLLGLFREHLDGNEREFTSVISAAVIYLRNLVKRRKKIDSRMRRKYLELQKLDFNLKTGRIHPGPELEIFLFYLFS